MCDLNSERIKKRLELFIFPPNFTTVLTGYRCDLYFLF